MRLCLEASTLKGVAFGSIMFASSCLNNLFVTYYLDLFMNVVQITPFWFFVGQSVFMVWNALNDPLFGWISDTLMLDQRPGACSSLVGAKGVNRRLAAIKYGGILWAMAFLVVWFPPWEVGTIQGLYFCFALCFYDGMLSLVEVNHSALLAEITTSGSERAKYNAWSAVFAGIGSLSSFFGHRYWDKEDLRNFRLVCLFVSFICALVFVVSSDLLRSLCSNGKPTLTSKIATACTSCGPGSNANGVEHHVEEVPQRQEEKTVDGKDKELSVWKFIMQMTSHHNFWIFELVYFVQAFDCTFEKNHFGIFLEGLAGSTYSAEVQGGIISASFILPWVGTVIITPAIQRYGLYHVVRGLFTARVIICIFGVILGTSGPTSACFFLLVNRVMSEAVCRVCPLIITDLVDEDQYLEVRSTSMSATIVGASTLFGKGSQSLAPMFGYAMLSKQFQGEQVDSSFLSRILVAVPFACVLLQWWLWSMYTLRGDYLKKVKKHLAKNKQQQKV